MKTFTVTYNWSKESNNITESQILGNGCVDPETLKMSEFGRKIQSAKIGEVIEKRSAWNQCAMYRRNS